MVKGIYRTPVHSMPLDDVKKFIGPENLKGKQKEKGLIKGTASHVTTSLIVKFDRIMHKIFTGEWVNNDKIRSTLKKEISIISQQELSAQPSENVDEFNARVEIRNWIHQSISQIRSVCNAMVNKGVSENKVNDILTDLDGLDNANEDGLKEETIMIQKKIEEKGKVKGKDKSKKSERKEKVKEEEKVEYKEAGQGKKALWKVEAEKFRELKIAKSKDASQISVEDRKKISAKVIELISAAESGEYEGIVRASLGAYLGPFSSENRALDRIRNEAKGEFSKQESKPQAIRSEVIEVIRLIHKAFTQDVTLIGDDPMRGGDRIPAQGVPENIQQIIDELKAMV